MAIYKPDKTNYYNETDDIGTIYSLKRLKDESSYSFQERIEYQARETPGSDIVSIGSYMNNCLGFLDTPIFKIDRKKNSNGEIIYPFCYFEINSCFFKIVENFHIDKEILIRYRDFETFDDLIKEINSYGILVCSHIENAKTDIWKETYKLRCENNLRQKDYTFFEERIVDVEQEDLISLNFFSEESSFREVESFEEIEESGDYFLDEVGGKVHFGDEAQTGYIVSVFAEFPFYVKKQNIKISKCSDSGFNFLIKEDIVEDSDSKKVKINSLGCKFYNDLFEDGGNYWGK